MKKPVSPLSPEALLDRAYALKNDSEAQALYADWARTYDKTMLEGLGYLTPGKTAKLLADHMPSKQARILDVGSGTGLAGLELAKLGFGKLDALDYSPAMLAVAKSRGIYDNIIEADLNNALDIASGSYDAMICTGTFTHAHVGAGCLDELFRILKPGGLFACTVHKDIWKEAGFSYKSAKLEKSNTLKTLYHKPGTYYSNSTKPEGWYIVWQRC